jgi:sortase A
LAFPPLPSGATPRPIRPGSTAVLWLKILAVWAPLTCALLAGSVFTYALWFSGLSQARAQEGLYNEFRPEVAQATAPLGGVIEPGSPVAVIDAPTIGLHQVVVEGTDSQQMAVGPGHRRDSPLPGQPGASVIYGHSAAFGAPFAHITDLRTGDQMTVTTGQGIFTYKVTEVRRPNDPLPGQVGSGQSLLTLVTSEGDGWREGWAPDHVVYVDALMQGDTQLPPPGRPSSVATAERAMQGDPDGFVTLVLWLQLLVVAAIAAIWARVRWGGAQTWLVAGPVLLAALWGIASSAAILLPNLS